MSSALLEPEAVADLERTRAMVRAALGDAARSAAAGGLPLAELEGQLIRPLAAYAVALHFGMGEDRRFWSGVLAVQLAHEASLVHDDIIDGAAERRGRPTLVAVAGAARALVHGDHLLTASYRQACETGSLELVAIFSRAVERTVAAEIEQGRGLGQRLHPVAGRRIAEGKAGELLGFAMAIAPAVASSGRVSSFYRLGKSLGVFYQTLDDLLDYCPSAGTGKPALGDHAQRRWTWPLAYLEADPFALAGAEVVQALCAGSAGEVPIQHCLAHVERSARTLLRRIALLLPGDSLLTELVEEWVERARAAVRVQLAMRRASGGPAARVSAAFRLRVPEGLDHGYFAASGTFRFAARLLPAEEARKVARVYAYCRALDDLVDNAGDESPESTFALLDEWVHLSELAYGGAPTGVAVIDEAMLDMAASGVPLAYAAGLVEGMRMDLRGSKYETLVDLRGYSYHVASVVGLWLTRLFGTHDPAVLDDAARLGQAMQLTNILRDVGEDWDRGRLYLPRDLLRGHGLEAVDIGDMRSGRRSRGENYRSLMEKLMLVAESDYERAFASIPALPGFFRGPVAVAARVYRGIHRSIRANDYDNLTRRAYTSGPQKAAMGARALWDLRRLSAHPVAPPYRGVGPHAHPVQARAGWG